MMKSKGDSSKGHDDRGRKGIPRPSSRLVEGMKEEEEEERTSFLLFFSFFSFLSLRWRWWWRCFFLCFSLKRNMAQVSREELHLNTNL